MSWVAAFFVFPVFKEKAMSYRELNEAVARATGESLAEVHSRGFSIADPLEVNYDPEPCRAPLVLDWDSMAPSEWPE
jgi:hypothetical protein